ncbi:Rossmann-like domain-containing protein [Desulfobulbus oligotrophicus]|uniref:Heavy-metal chelation domain-containing protein n=1 Tax=Desulfobulbus oligotrophicus TaxID=1909699 RepID=A0A7T5VE89_9BACT|nr:DUF364 domain-containing protein [Desulfobulbus oligotrophicus]QQG66152.1 hypothetical protein HP555_09880 [Desulfobulbus oligotrophicus]
MQLGNPQHPIYSQLLHSAQEILADETVQECAIGKKCVAVATERGVGLAFTTDSAWKMIRQTNIRALEKRLQSCPLRLLLPHYLQDDPLHCALALAAINSLLLSVSGDPCQEKWIDSLKKGQKLALIGHFRPLLEELHNRGFEPIIFELLPLRGTFPPERAVDLLPLCDAVLITGSTFANKTIHNYLPHIHPEADVWISGPSTPLADFLLDRFSLGSRVVCNRQVVLEAVRTGAGMRNLKQVMCKVVRKRNQTVS